jgi:hypothetical protein
MGDTKATTEAVFARIFEIQIYEPTTLSIGPALFHEIEGTLVLNEEMLVKRVQKHGIILILDLPGSLDRSHPCHSIVPTPPFLAVSPKKGIKRPITQNRLGDGHVYYRLWLSLRPLEHIKFSTCQKSK